jgi:hypothetical protein
MKRNLGRHQLIAMLGGFALIALTAACGNGGNSSPSITSTTGTTTQGPSSTTVSPTEKDVSPSGGNLFTPPIKATPAPNVSGGTHPGINGVP